MPVIKDWVVQAQWDDSKISKGLKRLEKAFKKVNLAEGASARIRGNKLRTERNITQQYVSQTRQFAMQERIKRAIFRTDQQIASMRGVRGGEGTMASLTGQRAGLASIGERLAGTTLTLKGLQDLQREYGAIGDRARVTGKQVSGLTKKMTTQQMVTGGLRDSLRNLSRSYISLFAVIAGGTAVFRIGEQLDQIRASLLSVSGSSVQVAKDWKFISKTASGLGVDLTVAAKGYQQIGVAADAMGFTVDQARNIFLAAAEGSKAFGLSTEDQMGIQRAFVQIMSKGVLSMEELKSQLGDRMPVAMALAAKSMGYPNEKMGEFIKLVSEGKIESREFILKFSDALRQNVRDTGGLAAALKTVATARQNFTTAFKQDVSAGFTVATEGIVEFFKTLTVVLHDNVGSFKVLGTLVGIFFRTLGTAIDIISPVLFIFSFLLDRIRVMFADALDIKKTRTEIGFLSNIIRSLSGLLQMMYGAFQVLFGSIIYGLKQLGIEQNGLSGLADVLAIIFGATIIGGMVKFLAKLTGITALLKGMGKIGGALGGLFGGKVGKVASKTSGLLGKGKNLLKGFPLVGAGIASYSVGTALNNIGYGKDNLPLHTLLTDFLMERREKSIAAATRAGITVHNPQFNIQNPVGGDIEGAMNVAAEVFAEQLTLVGGT